MKWPLWFSNEIVDSAEAAPISDEIKDDLRSWNAFYRAHFDDDWDDDANAVAYNTEGRALARRLVDELGPDFLVLLAVETSSVDRMEWVEVAPSQSDQPG